MNAAFSSLVTMVDIYDMNIVELAQGKIRIPGRAATGQEERYLESEHKLRASDLLLLGQMAFNRGYYDRSVESLEACLTLVDPVEEPKTQQECQQVMETVVKKHDEALRRQGHPRDWNPNVEGKPECVLIVVSKLIHNVN